MTKILITGAGGQLGRECAEVFSGRFTVAALTSKELDITKPELVMHVLERQAPDIILNCAAFTKVDACETEKRLAWMVNAQGPGNLAEAARKTGSHLIHISTDYVFDGRKPVPQAYVETDDAIPVSWYGKTKLAGELAVQKNAGSHLIIRTAWLYGIHGKNFLKTILRSVLKNPGQELRVVNDQFGSMTWVYTLALQIVKLIEEGVDGICHATAEGYCTWYEAALCFLERVGVEFRIRPCATWEYPTPADRPENSILENRRMKDKSVCIMEDWRKDTEIFADRYRDQLIKEALAF